MSNRVAFLNDGFIEEKNACLHVSDLSIQRGYGIFDYCRTSANTPVFLEAHISRFFHSSKLMHLDVPMSKKELQTVIHLLIEKNNIPQSGIRMLLTGGYSPDSYEIIQPNLIILQHPLTIRQPAPSGRGIKVITHEYAREFPEAKTINYSMGIWLQRKIQENNAVDVLYHNQGEISEFPRSNFFLVTKNDTIVTPKKNILYGITRKKILELASKNFLVEERTVTLKEIEGAQEAFMTSTTKRILPITQIDDIVVGSGRPGNISIFLNEILESVESINL
jgi:branched-subunit amino acid aminotransferase/4-amino-4-deoxychorismate lyase